MSFIRLFNGKADKISDDEKLALAARGGDTEQLKKLLERHAGVEAVLDGYTPLMWAAVRGDTEMVKLLLGKHASPYAEGANKATPLRLAIDHGHFEAAAILLEKAPTLIHSHAGVYGDTLLIYAVCNRQPEAVKLLLDNKALVNATDALGRSALNWAVRNKDQGIARLLKDHLASIDMYDNTRQSPLTLAIQAGDTDMMQLLIGKHYYDIEDGNTLNPQPLMAAVDCGRIEAIDVLLQAGAHVDIQDQYGNTPLLKAISGNKVDIIRRLLQGGAKVDMADNYGRTPLMQAVDHKRGEVIDLLIRHGADLDIARHNSTALDMARSARDPDSGIISMLEKALQQRDSAAAARAAREEESARDAEAAEQAQRAAAEESRRSLLKAQATGRNLKPR